MEVLCVMNLSFALVPFQEMKYWPISSFSREAWQKAVSADVEVNVMSGQRCFGMKNSSPWIMETFWDFEGVLESLVGLGLSGNA